jgi:predicted ribosome quality control (RQC) complex YloA/Tae2 family protein
MTFDALTMAAVRQELEREIGGGMVQRAVQTGPLAIGLEIYNRRQRHLLVCSAEPEAARVCLGLDRPVRDTDTPSPLLLLLRKYVRDGRIVGLEQPPLERLLRLRIAKRDEQGVLGEVSLIIEVMGRRSNVLLVGPDGLILDALKRSGPTRNPRRPVLPRRPYVDPPPQDRLDPRDAGALDQLRAKADERPLETLLANNLAGFSPLAAREAAYRADGLSAPARTADWSAVRAAVGELLAPIESGEWSPCVAERNGLVVSFAPYRLTHVRDAELKTLATISTAIELGSAAAAAPRQAPLVNRELIAQVDVLRERAERKLSALERTRLAAEQAETLRLAGEAVLANLSQIQPGQASLDFAGRQIDLAPELSPLENAQRLFKEYRRARDATRQVPEMIAATHLELRQLDDLQVLAEVADSPPRQRALSAELADLATPRPEMPKRAPSAKSKARPRSPEGQVLRSRTLDGCEVLVGTSSRGNEAVTFKLAGPDDVWLHARGVPGAHVILRTGGREVSAPGLIYAARLAARNSQARGSGRVEVDYTACKHVRKIPAAPPGLVTYRGEKTLSVTPQE